MCKECISPLLGTLMIICSLYENSDGGSELIEKCGVAARAGHHGARGDGLISA